LTTGPALIIFRTKGAPCRRNSPVPPICLNVLNCPGRAKFEVPSSSTALAVCSMMSGFTGLRYVIWHMGSVFEDGPTTNEPPRYLILSLGRAVGTLWTLVTRFLAPVQEAKTAASATNNAVKRTFIL